MAGVACFPLNSKTSEDLEGFLEKAMFIFMPPVSWVFTTEASDISMLSSSVVMLNSEQSNCWESEDEASSAFPWLISFWPIILLCCGNSPILLVGELLWWWMWDLGGPEDCDALNLAANRPLRGEGLDPATSWDFSGGDEDSFTGVLPDRVHILCVKLGLFTGVCIFGFNGEAQSGNGLKSDSCESMESNSPDFSVILQGKLSVLLIFPDLIMDGDVSGSTFPRISSVLGIVLGDAIDFLWGTLSGVLKTFLSSGLLFLPGVSSLGKHLFANIRDSGTLIGFSDRRFRGDGDHVTLFFGVLPFGLLSQAPLGETQSKSKRFFIGVFSIPLSGLFLGVSTTRLFVAGDRKGLPRRVIPFSPTVRFGVLGDRGVVQQTADPIGSDLNFCGVLFCFGKINVSN